MALTVSPALGDVAPDRDVWPFDNPFFPFHLTNEGLPPDGNELDPFLGPTAAEQDTGEPGDFEGEEEVIVGRSNSGSLLISGGDELRYEDLTIGGHPDGTNGGVFAFGSMRIDGQGSLYNNNYEILPPFLDFATFGSTREVDAMEGFDLYVGRTGSGILEIVAGGAAEIQDAVSVGDAGSAVGLLIVDGAGSLLINGGFEASGPTTDEEIHQFVVGRLGTGTVRILNGGKIISRGPTSTTGGSTSITGAAIGGAPHDGSQPPDAGGTGLVELDGIGSSWTVGGDLQVGGFHGNHNLSLAMMGDEEGDEVIYANNVGKGTLLVKNGALVNISSPVDPESGDEPNSLNLLVGRRGTVDLQGGRIVMQGGFEPGSDPPDLIIEDVQVINDGLITGDGSIETGLFNNRYEGIVRVNAGQKLVVDSTTTFLPPMRRLPLANWGVIEVLGTETARAEIVFNRVDDLNVDVLNAFQNNRSPMPPVGGRVEGQIIAQDATLRFESGLINNGLLSFSAGSNVVTGEIVNEAPLVLGDPGGVIFVSGDNTSVLFENELVNNGIFELAPNISLVTLLEGLTMGGSGAFSTSVGGRPTGQEINNLSVVGDISLDGTLEVSLFTAPGVPTFSPQPGDTFEIMSSASEMTGDFAFISLPFVSPTVGLFAFPDYNLDAYFITTLGFNPANGADFNADGIVDDDDLAIWRQNVGNPGGLGDANNDGIVNARDFFVWLDQQGGMGMPVPGSGAGSGQAVGAVPEPSSIALLLSGGMLALAAARRRRSHCH